MTTHTSSHAHDDSKALQRAIALALSIRYDGEMMGKLDCYTDTTHTLSTLAVLIGANLATVAAKLATMRATFSQS